ncbi:response regulator transcription factor [Phyllobacterium lublinensis]|uniref:response regulator transcription factor n=1 Tax=Phyllobacterium lublinensis TaxID=2875708 RepID=UPI001CCB62CC|nr:LuxR C-terminal-related transcriptional regulator [Phyllobacterium sp. 2063]MBZ9653631.1 LuxR C-terminal-related transcriptional regulator [Phyllobacterium sp. 2063]
MESAHIRQIITGHSNRTAPARTDRASVIVVDDVSADWAPLGKLLEASGIGMTVTGEMPEHLLHGRPIGILCLILGTGPGRDCLDFQRRLSAANVFIPIIFVAEFGNISMSVAAMKNGAIDFLGRPCSDEELHQSVETALACDRKWNDENRRLSALKARYNTLTGRERQVMWMVAAGRLNKQIGWDLGISEITVKAHRARMLQKMEATSLPELTRITDQVAQIVEQPNIGVKTESHERPPLLPTPRVSSKLPFFETKSMVRVLQQGQQHLGGGLLAF